MKRVKIMSGVMMLLADALTVAGCFQKERDYDASCYVKSSLDAVYREGYKEYAKYLNKSEKEAKETIFVQNKDGESKDKGKGTGYRRGRR